MYKLKQQQLQYFSWTRWNVLSKIWQPVAGEICHMFENEALQYAHKTSKFTRYWLLFAKGITNLKNLCMNTESLQIKLGNCLFVLKALNVSVSFGWLNDDKLVYIINYI